MVTATTTYFLTIFPAEKWMKKKFEWLRRSFLWSSHEEANSCKGLLKLDDPLRHWRKDKFEAAVASQAVNFSNSNKNSSLEYLMLSKFLCRPKLLDSTNDFFGLAIK
jgi:hypothetical protein